MKKVLSYLKGYEKQCILGPLFKLLEASFELLLPLVVASIVDNGILGADHAHVVKMCLVMILLGIVGLASSVTAQYFSAVAAVGFSAKLRHALLQNILGFSYQQIDQQGTSTLITRMTSDVNQVQNGVNLTLRLLLRSPFVVFGAMFMAFTIDWKAALVFVAVIPLLCLVVFGIMLITMPMYKKVQSNLDQLTSATRQNLSGVRVLWAFCMEDAQVTEYQQKTQTLTTSQLKAGSISNLMNPMTLVLINLAVVVLVQVGALQVEAGILTQGLVIALYNYMSQILVELVKMANMIITLTKAVACGKRLSSILDTQPDQADGSFVPQQFRGDVCFEDVTAGYGDSSALEHISFSAPAGSTVGIIGGTGAGKTTLVNLIARLYDVKQGRVLLDGIPASEYQLEALRQEIGIVPQKAVLFQGSIRENLLWGNPQARDEDLWQALEIAQAAQVVREKEGGLDAAVEQGGQNFSGGQRQRLTIARALVRKPKILILDDSASALDYATDAALRMAIAAMENSPTTFIVSQRAASVRFAQEILVLDEGCLAGKGNHDELLASCPVYQEIYYSQFPKEVAANEK